MKNIILLLIMAVVFAGVVSANTVYPSGDKTLEAALSEYSAEGPAVTSDTVLATAMPLMAQPSSYMALAVETRNKTDQVMNAIEKQVIMATTPDMISLRPRITGLYISCAWFTAADFYLRC